MLLVSEQINEWGGRGILSLESNCMAMGGSVIHQALLAKEPRTMWLRNLMNRQEKVVEVKLMEREASVQFLAKEKGADLFLCCLLTGKRPLKEGSIRMDLWQ